MKKLGKMASCLMLIILTGAALLFIMPHGHVSSGNLVTASVVRENNSLNLSNDPYLITASIFGNSSSALGFSGATTEYFSGSYENLPQSMILIVQSPGPSTVSVILNGSYVTQNVAFDNGQLNYSFTTTVTGKQNILIYIRSGYLNATKAITLRLDIMTVSQFVNYANALVKKNTFQWTPGAVAQVVMSAGVGAIVGPELYDYYRWERARHPIMARYQVGGVA